MIVQCLLEGYYGERLPTEKGSEDEGDAVHNFCHGFFSMPNPKGLCTGAGIGGIGSGFVQHRLLERRWYGGNAELSAAEMQAIRNVGAQLRATADRLQIRSNGGHNRETLAGRGFGDDEIGVVMRFGERTSTTVSHIANSLKACLTYNTFSMALRFLSESTTTTHDEVTAVCELARLIYPRIQDLIQAGVIYRHLHGVIEEKLSDVL